MDIEESKDFIVSTSSLKEVRVFSREVFEKINIPQEQKNELTMLLASHNMREVERLCDQVIMMKEGEIVDRGTCQSLIDKHGRNNLEDTFLKLARKKNELE